MAKSRIQGITVEINGDTTKLSKALEGVNKNIRNTQTQLKDVEKLLKLDPTNTELLAQKQKLLASEVSSAKDKLETLKKASEEAAKTKDNYDAWKAKYDPIKQKITETEDKLKSLKEQSKIADEQLSKGEISQEKYDSIQNEIKSTSDELKNLKKSAQDVSDEFGHPISSEQFDSLQREIVDTQQELQRLQNEADKSRTALVKIGEAGETLQNVGGKISNAGEKFLPLTAGITAIGTGAVKTTADFDSEMSKVAAVSGATGKDFDDLRAKAREMGAKTKFSATEAAEAMYYMAMAGWKTEAMLNGIDGVMNLAAASGEDLGTTSDIVTDALTALGYGAEDAGHFADVLAAASTNANTNVSLMGESFKYVAPVAGSMGASAEDLAIALGVMANAGVKGTQAGNSLKNALVNLVKPTAKQTKAMEQLNLISSETGQSAFVDEYGNMKSLKDIMDIFRSSLDKVNVDLVDSEGNVREYDDIIAELSQTEEGLTQAEQLKNAAIIFGKQNLSGMLAIVNASEEDYDKLTEAIYGCDGTAQNMAETMQDNLAGQITILKSQLAELAISFGDILMPAIREITAKVQAFIDKLNAMSPATKETILKIALIVAAIGPALLIVGKLISTVGKIMTTIPKIVNSIKLVKTAMSKLNLTFLKSPVFIVITAITALVAAFVYLWNNCDEFRQFWIDLWNSIQETLYGFFEAWETGWNVMKTFFVNLWNGLQENFQIGMEAIRNTFNKIWTSISTTFITIITSIKNTAIIMFTAIKNFIITIFTDVYNFFANIFNAIHNIVSTVITTIHDKIISVWTAIYETIKPLLDAFGYLFETIFQAIQILIGRAMDWISEKILSIWNTIANFIAPILESIKTTFEIIWNGISNAISTILDSIYNVLVKVWTDVSNFISEVLNAIWTLIQTIWNNCFRHIKDVLNKIWGIVSSIWNTISGYMSSVLNSIYFVISSIWNKVNDFISEILNTIFKTISNIWNNIKDTISNVMTIIKNIIVNIWDNIKSSISNTITNIKDTVIDGFNGAVDFIKGLADDAWNWGADIINGIIEGIKSKINDVADAVTGVAATIKSYLHFSVPDEGPLTDFESWMPDFMKGLAEGINKSKQYVEKAVESVADAMQISLNSDISANLDNISGAMINGNTAGTVNNYYQNDNSRTVNQTNNSPKSLSRLEIYRQTRNALNV